MAHCAYDCMVEMLADVVTGALEGSSGMGPGQTVDCHTSSAAASRVPVAAEVAAIVVVESVAERSKQHRVHYSRYDFPRDFMSKFI